MSDTVLLSIKPEYAEKIFNGSKKFEFRRIIFKSKNIKKIIVYASYPIQRVIGEFELDEILSGEKEKLWETTCKYSGIKKEYYDQYFIGKDIAHAIKVKNVLRYARPLHINSLGINRPPQSFQYLPMKKNKGIT